MSALNFVNGLALHGPRDPSGTVAAGLNAGFNDDAAVVGGSVITFAGSIGEQDRADVLNSMLYAQVLASTVFDRVQDYERWYWQYQNVLETVGWSFPTRLQLARQPANRYPSVDRLVIHSMGQVLSEQSEIDQLVATMGALRSADQQTIDVLNNEAMQHSFDQATFQVGVASDTNGEITLKLGAYYYHTSRDIKSHGGVMFYRLIGDHSVQFFAGEAEIIFNTEVYGPMRPVVIDRLGKDIELIRPFDV